jgi:membrane protease YdiL (CAAX protease family)
MVAFTIALLLLWSPLVLLIFVVWGVNSTTSTITLVILYGLFLGLAWVWASQVYGHSRPWQYYGLSWTPDNGLAFLGGLGLGGFVLLGLLGLELRLGWILWKPPAIAFPQVLVEGLIVAIAVGVTEEVLFRGWLLTELERDCAPGPALAWSSLLFALLHFIRPLPEILRTWPRVFGLFLLGATLVWAKRCCGGNLGLAIGLHAGLVWGYYAIDVGQLIAYSGAVPTWVTGINQNPLAGVMGLVWLGGLAWGFQRYALHHPD